MVAQLLQFAATVLLATTLGADILTFIYLVSRDGFKSVVTKVPSHIVPAGQYEQGLYLIASFLIIWELAGLIFSISSPSSMLLVLIGFIVLGGILVAMKQYDDAREKELDQPQTMLVLAFPLPASEYTADIVSLVRTLVTPYEPIYVNKVTKTLLELRESLGIDILHEQHSGKGDKHAIS
jgi:hypothetical protein